MDAELVLIMAKIYACNARVLGFQAIEASTPGAIHPSRYESEAEKLEELAARAEAAAERLRSQEYDA